MYFLKVHFKYNFSQLISRKAYMLQESWQHASCLPAWLRKDFKYLPSPVVLMIFVFCLPQPSSSWAGNFIAKESLLIWGSSWKWVLLWVKNKELHDVSFFSSVYQNHPEGLLKNSDCWPPCCGISDPVSLEQDRKYAFIVGSQLMLIYWSRDHTLKTTPYVIIWNICIHTINLGRSFVS